MGSVVLTQYNAQPAAEAFQKRLESLGGKGVPALHHPRLPLQHPPYRQRRGLWQKRVCGDLPQPGGGHRPGPGQRQNGHLPLPAVPRVQAGGSKAGYAKFETFPIWNLPLNHPVNLAYEAATADLNDVNMIDPFHLEAYGETAVNYNRDVEVFPVLNAMLEKIMGQSPYKCPPRTWA